MAIKIGVINNVIREQGVEALKVAGELGFEGVEFFVPALWDDDSWLDSAFQQELKSASGELGVAISSICLAYQNQYPLASPDPAARWAGLQALLNYIEVAHAVGAGQMLLAFYGQGELAYKRQFPVLVEQLRAAAPCAEQAGVKLGLESTLSSEQYLAILDAVGSPAVNIYLDSLNPYNWHYKTAEQIRALGPRLGQFHFKDADRETGKPADLGDGIVEWDDVCAALKEIGYEGWGVLETSSLHGDPKADAHLNLEKARQLAARCV